MRCLDHSKLCIINDVQLMPNGVTLFDVSYLVILSFLALPVPTAKAVMLFLLAVRLC